MDLYVVFSKQRNCLLLNIAEEQLPDYSNYKETSSTDRYIMDIFRSLLIATNYCFLLRLEIKPFKNISKEIIKFFSFLLCAS